MDYFSLANTKLFHDISSINIENVLRCLQSRLKTYKKNELIFSVGDKTKEFGLVISGLALIETNDLWGNRSILGIIEKNNIFAESYAFTNEKLKVNVIAGEDTKILFLNASSVISRCSKSCYFHTKLIENLLSISSKNNIQLSERILNTSSKTIRGKLVAYFSQEAQKSGSSKFKIPLNRQELADYLNVNRSALSNELSKMRDEKILSFHKNEFVLLNIKL